MVSGRHGEFDAYGVRQFIGCLLAGGLCYEATDNLASLLNGHEHHGIA